MKYLAFILIGYAGLILVYWVTSIIGEWMNDLYYKHPVLLAVKEIEHGEISRMICLPIYLLCCGLVATVNCLCVLLMVFCVPVWMTALIALARLNS